MSFFFLIYFFRNQFQTPLKNYLKCFDTHISFLNVNVNALVEEYRPIVKDDISVIKRQQLTARVDMHVKERMNVSNTIPSDITELGLIVIDTTAIRNELIEKHDVSIYIIIINQKKADYKKQIKTPKTSVYN